MFVDNACPTTVSITPSDGPFTAGDVLTCVSDGQPEPSYQWTKKKGKRGTTGKKGRILSTTSTMTLKKGKFRLMCTATVDMDPPCSAWVSISGKGK